MMTRSELNGLVLAQEGDINIRSLRQREMIYCTFKPSTISATFSFLKEEFQDKHNSLNGLTAGCWGKCMYSLHRGAHDFPEKAPPLHYCQMESLLVASLQFEPGRASSEGYMVEASWLINKRLINIYCVWNTLFNSALQPPQILLTSQAQLVSTPLPPLLILTHVDIPC